MTTATHSDARTVSESSEWERRVARLRCLLFAVCRPYHADNETDGAVLCLCWQPFEPSLDMTVGF